MFKSNANKISEIILKKKHFLALFKSGLRPLDFIYFSMSEKYGKLIVLPYPAVFVISLSTYPGLIHLQNEISEI